MSQLAANRSFKQKATSYRDLLRYHFGQTRQFAKNDYYTFQKIRANVKKHIDLWRENLRVLDIGCGQRYPNTLLFANFGVKESIGIDTDIVGPGVSKYVRMLAENGLERTVRSAVREAIFDHAYFSTLSRELGGKLSRKNLRILNSDGATLPFDKDYFDLIISNAVFEHIDDIPGVLAELNRVTKPDGVYHILIHLYPSLSGGHNLEWAFPDINRPSDVPPWDHLRGNKYPTHIYLNKLKESDYRNLFEKYTQILEWIDGPLEGVDLLDDNIISELSEYSREDLLKRYVIAVCRPK